MAKLMIDNVPEDVKKQFKAYCAINEKTMREVLITFMRQVSGDPEDLVSLIASLAEQAWGEAIGGKNERYLKELKDAVTHVLRVAYDHTLDSIVEEIY